MKTTESGVSGDYLKREQMEVPFCPHMLQKAELTFEIYSGEMFTRTVKISEISMGSLVCPVMSKLNCALNKSSSSLHNTNMRCWEVV